MGFAKSFVCGATERLGLITTETSNMARTTTFTSLFLLAAFATGCSASSDPANGSAGAAAAPSHLPPGVDPESDDDGDGLKAADDWCLDTEKGAWTSVDGCGEDEDGDADGLPTDRDLCPGTPKGEAVDGNGCSESQKNSGSNTGAGGSSGGTPGGDPSIDNKEAGKNWQPGDDGKVGANGFATFILDPKGAYPVVIRTLEKNVKKLQDGFELSGTLSIQIPAYQQLTFLEAKVMLKMDSSKGQGLQAFEGTCRLPFPAQGLMQGMKVNDLAIATVGYEVGSEIQNVDAPIKADRKYFYFNFSGGLSATLANTTLSVGPNVAATMTLDPSDPSFFLNGTFGGMLGPVEKGSIGLSWGGHIPFTPKRTWGIDAQAASFDGHVWLGGKISLVKLPLAVEGNTVIDLDPDDDGKSYFQDVSGGLKFGSNSDVMLSLSAKKIAGISVPLGGTTIIGHANPTKSYAYYSGELKAGHAFGNLLPISNTSTMKVAGYLSQDIEESYLKAQGNVSLDATTLSNWTGLDLGELAMAQVNLDINKDGVLVKGQADASFSPLIGLNGSATAEAFFNGAPGDWYVKMDGNMTVKGINLSATAHAELSKNGIFMAGKMTTPISSVDMSGSITSAGVDLSGSATVTIPIVAGKEVAQWVTDAAVCGYETVTDAAVCGYQTVTSAAKCGTQAVTSAALCGTKTVTSAAQCGTEYVTSTAKCGTKTVTSATQCGVKYVSCGASCVISLFQDCKCTEAKSCQVAASCYAAKTCQVAATCNIANTCSVPASCQKVKTCEQKVTIPDFNYGSFQGNVTVKIGNSGLTGSVSGQYCTTANNCTTLAGGRIDTSGGTPKACVDVAGLGEFCAAF